MRQLGLLSGDWEDGVSSELTFWRMALSNHGAGWSPELLAERLDPSHPLQAEIQKLLDPRSNHIRILDVGAGPLTNLGKTWGDRKIDITAVDPLAEEYDGLLEEIGMIPPVRTKKAFAESLLDAFPENTFDIVHASNSLDHALDPIEAIKQMLAVTKPGGHAFLSHFRNVGANESYAGLHQWNFDENQGDMTISNGKTTCTLSRELGAIASVQARLTTWRGSDVVVAVIKKAAR